MLLKQLRKCGGSYYIPQLFVIIGLVTLVLLNLYTLTHIFEDSNVQPLVMKERNSDRKEIPQNVPPIVHLSWKDVKIPNETVQWVKRWQETNPNLEVWFWTDASTNNFIQRKYPEIVPIYQRYKHSIFRADAARYMILYEYGGIWADLDIEPLKSLDPIREQYSAILSQESEVHSKIGWSIPVMICNAFMATREKHPFFKFLIHLLEVNQKETNPVKATGPAMLTRMYQVYVPLYKAIGSQRAQDAVHIAPQMMFLPTVDVLAYNNLRKQCETKKIRADNQYLCDKYLTDKFKNQPDNTSYTDHHWWHSWLGGKKYKIFVPINEVLPDVIFPEKSGKF